jgi:DNA polymerase III subunit epsilon
LNDRNQAILWARLVLKHPDKYYILDTETTGLENAEIIELGIIDLAGNEIISQRFCPTVKVEPGATQIHGLDNLILDPEPPFYSIMDRLEPLLADRITLIYNAMFDYTAMSHTYNVWNSDLPVFRNGCVMHWYSQFCGEWNDYRGSYRWQKLPGGDHSAIGDCKATLSVIKHMAETELIGQFEPIQDLEPCQTSTSTDSVPF